MARLGDEECDGTDEPAVEGALGLGCDADSGLECVVLGGNGQGEACRKGQNDGQDGPVLGSRQAGQVSGRVGLKEAHVQGSDDSLGGGVSQSGAAWKENPCFGGSCREVQQEWVGLAHRGGKVPMVG